MQAFEGQGVRGIGRDFPVHVQHRTLVQYSGDVDPNCVQQRAIIAGGHIEDETGFYELIFDKINDFFQFRSFAKDYDKKKCRFEANKFNKWQTKTLFYSKRFQAYYYI